MKKEIIKKEEKVAAIKSDISINTFILQAIKEKLPIEVMERFFALREKIKQEQAKEIYIEALAKFQGECPVIKKTKKVLNKDGITIRYEYAPIDAIVAQIKKPLAENGFAYTWTTENTNGEVKATVKVTHKMGHSETSSFVVPVDQEGFMTAPQKIASALTFAKRYSLCNALGISTGDEDDDSLSVSKQDESKSIKAQILFLLRNLGQEANTREQIQKTVKRLTQLDLVDKNFVEIKNRLKILVSEK